MSKKKPKKRVQSKTEKKLRGKLRYQKTKAKKIQKAIYKDSKDNNFDFNKKIGDSKLSTLINKEINETLKPVRNNIRELNKKLERFSKLDKPKKEKERDLDGIEIKTFGSVWQRAEIEDELFNGFFQFVDNLNIDTDSDLIFDNLFEMYYPVMDSQKILRGYYNSLTTNVDLFVDNMTAEELKALKKRKN